MNPSTVPKIVKDLYKKYPRFPDGRIDYSEKKTCAVLTIFVEYDGALLILKRSQKVSEYKGKWMTVAGYYDEPVPIRMKILEELREELGVDEKVIDSIEVFAAYKRYDVSIDKEWIIFTSRIVLKKLPKMRLDWEHVDYKWVIPKDLMDMDIIPSLLVSLRKVYKTF